MMGKGAPAHNYGTGIVRRSDLNKAAASVTAELQQIAHLQEQEDSSDAKQDPSKDKKKKNQVAPTNSSSDRKPSMSQRLATAFGGRHQQHQNNTTTTTTKEKKVDKNGKEEGESKKSSPKQQQQSSGEAPKGNTNSEEEEKGEEGVKKEDLESDKQRDSVMTEKDEEKSTTEASAQEEEEEDKKSEKGEEEEEEGAKSGQEDGGEDESQVSEKQMRTAFDLFDLDGSGEISAGEFGTVVRSLGENPTDEEVEAMLKSVDRDMDGTLDFDEFSKLMRGRLEERQQSGAADDQIFRDAFKVFDKDNSGKISRDELRKIVTSYGKMKLSDSDADEMLSAADADGDNLIDYEEFVKMFTDRNTILAA